MKLNVRAEQPLPKEKWKIRSKSWVKFKSHIQTDIYKIKPGTLKLLQHMNKDIKE
jgi:hypothetical protein